MSYQMTRVRGSDAYRLQITRQTTIEAICLWTGIDRDDLMSINPHVTMEELQAGQELVVLARWIDEEQRPEQNILAENWPSPLNVEAIEAAKESGDNIVVISFGPEKESDPSSLQDVVSDQVTASEAQADETDEMRDEADMVSDEAQTIDDAHRELDEETKEAEPEPDLTKEPVQKKDLEQSVTWRPFPKTVL